MDERHFYAHSFEGRPAEEWEPLEDHLDAVARLASQLAAAFGSAEVGYLAGLWHDLGKYHDVFQAHIRGDFARFDHAVYGAQLAHSREGTNPPLAHALAAIIAGHHAGLRDRLDLGQRLAEKGKDWQDLLRAAPPHFHQAELPPLPPFLRILPASPSGKAEREKDLRRRFELWIRFLFSALVDADSLATEEVYEQGKRQGVLGKAPSPADLRPRLDAFLEGKAAAARPSDVQRLRLEVLAACREKAAEAPGFFSLTVPTGGGKTFSSLAFALEHATRFGLRRVISVIPFTSILEQTAAEYAKALGRDNLIEHHSGLDPEVETRRNLMASENWDAPVVVTTAVQFFESLFAHRRSPCRKLHNIARSVILLDEAQTLPVQYLVPILDVLQTLVKDYGCTVLFSTATQPALNRSASQPEGLEGVREIVPDPAHLARAFERYRVAWPPKDAPPKTWPELASELAGRPQVLAIVHLRNDARELAELLPEGPELFHLSASLCAAHRSQVIAEVKDRLRQGLPCRLVSTQVVEAGVDIDFPVVYRALAGLDSLVQSGGRCNREGLLPEPGELIVFRAPTEPPPGILRQGLGKMEMLLKEHGHELKITDPELVAHYFRILYGGAVRDLKGIQANRLNLAFETVAQDFRMIDDAWQVAVLVPWGDAEERLEALRRKGPSRAAFRRLQPFFVNVNKKKAIAAQQAGLLEEVHGVLALLSLAKDLYHPRFGLDFEGRPGLDPGNLMI